MLENRFKCREEWYAFWVQKYWRQFLPFLFHVLAHITDISASNGIRYRNSKSNLSSSNLINGVYDKKLTFELIPEADVQSDFS